MYKMQGMTWVLVYTGLSKFLDLFRNYIRGSSWVFYMTTSQYQATASIFFLGLKIFFPLILWLRKPSLANQWQSQQCTLGGVLACPFKLAFTKTLKNGWEWTCLNIRGWVWSLEGLGGTTTPLFWHCGRDQGPDRQWNRHFEVGQLLPWTGVSDLPFWA